jgi:hypothetical protein
MSPLHRVAAPQKPCYRPRPRAARPSAPSAPDFDRRPTTDGDGLTLTESIFVRELLIHRSVTRAALLAGYLPRGVQVDDRAR